MHNLNRRFLPLLIIVGFIFITTIFLELGVLHAGSNDSKNSEEFLESFEDESLASPWFWKREDETKWNLSATSGSLIIHTSSGTLDKDHQINNLLLRPNTTSSNIFSTSLDFQPSQTAHEASIFLYKDDDNYIKLSRIFNDQTLGGDVFLFAHEVNGKFIETKTVPASVSTSELRLVTVGSTVSGFFINENGDMVQITSTAISEPFPYIGLSAYHGVFTNQPDPIAAKFDQVQVVLLDNQLYLPMINR